MSVILTIVRRLRHLPQPQISRQEAIAKAKADCDERGSIWIEPIRMTEHLDCYYIVTNVGMCGGHGTYRVDNQTGEVTAGSMY